VYHFKRFSSAINVMASLVLAILFSVPAGAQESAANEQLMSLTTQVQQLQDQVRVLTGKLEDQSFQLENLKRKQRDQYLDLDQRISEITSQKSTMNADEGGAQVTRPETQPVDRNSGAEVPEVRPAMTSKSAVTALPQPDVAEHETISTPVTEQAAYDKAFQALKELRYADAAEGFQDFLKNHPNSEYADNAQYWLGESYYVTRNYDIALEAFEKLVSKFPDSPKVGDSLLKIGYTHYELKQWDQARAALEQVQQQYPGTPLARLAESRLRSMRLEGHY